MEAIKYIVDTLLWLLKLAFVLRLLFQLVRADFRDPMADAIVRVTNWLILPLRRVATAGRQGRHRDRRRGIAGGLCANLCHHGLGRRWVPAICSYSCASPPSTSRDLLLRIYLFAMLLYWVTSFVSPGGYAPGVRLLAQLCEPILKPVRRIIPPIGQIDFSLLWVSIAIGALLVLLR